MVSGISFAGMACSALLSIGAPVALYFVIRKRCGKGIAPVLVGGAGFILFALVLGQVLHAIAFGIVPSLAQRPFW